MGDDKNNQLVPRPGSEITTPERRKNRVMEGMTRDILDRAKAKELSAARFRVGDYLLRGPDYRQIMRWAEAGGLKPEEVLERLAGRVMELGYPAAIDPVSFSMEDGAMLSFAWDFEHLPFTPDIWEPGLLIRELGLIWPSEPCEPVEPGSHPVVLRPNLPFLKTLIFDGAPLKTLDLSQVPGLIELYFWSGYLSELDLTPVPELTILGCSLNGLTELDLTPVPGLLDFDCSRSDLSALDLTPVPGLLALYCWSCNLSELDLTQVPGLFHLDCSENYLKELDLTPVPRLTVINCSNNGLKELDLTPVPGLTTLDCKKNNLTELDLKSVTGLTDLLCDKELRVHNAPAGLKINYRKISI